jgi:hypothetical protein
MAKKLLIMPPSYRRRPDTKPLPAIKRYDGVLYRVLRRNLKSDNVDILVLTEDLELVWADEELPYKRPKGEDNWSGFGPKDVPAEVVERNVEFLKKVFEKDYDEVFVALGEKFRKAIGEIEKITDAKVTYISGKGLGPYAQCLKAWLEKVGR